MTEEIKELIEIELLGIIKGYKTGEIKEEDLIHRKEEIKSYIQHYRGYPEHDSDLASIAENLIEGCQITRKILKIKK